MVYLWIFLGLILAIIGLVIANLILKRVNTKRADIKIKKGE